MGADIERAALGRSRRPFLCSALRPPPVESAAPEGTHRTSLFTHTLTICRLTLTSPNKRPHFPNPPRPGEPGTRLSSLPHPIPSPVTRSRKSSSSHARATLTLTAPPCCFSCALSSCFSRWCLSRAHSTHVLLSTAQRKGSAVTSAARVRARCARRGSSVFERRRRASVVLMPEDKPQAAHLIALINGRTYIRYALGL